MTLFDRLFSKTIICANGCWEFTGARNYGGYGQIRDESGRQRPAHRIAYDLVVDDIPEGMLVLHSCDNPPCINPAHLFLGTGQDNMDDMWMKERANPAIGLQLPQTKLTPDEVKQIKLLLLEDTMEGNELAYKFGVSPQTICDIKAGRTWKHVEV